MHIDCQPENQKTCCELKKNIPTYCCLKGKVENEGAGGHVRIVWIALPIRRKEMKMFVQQDFRFMM